MKKKATSKTEINKWAKNLTGRVYQKWKNDFSLLDQGFKVFYGPVHYKPKLVIISLNPGSKGHTFDKDKTNFKKGNFALPKTTPYANNKPLAKKMQKLFDKDRSILENSVTFPLIFFRSKDEKSLKREHAYHEMAEYSYKIVTEILNKVKPKRILVIGMSTHSKLKKNILNRDFVEQKIKKNAKGSRLAIKSMWNNTKIISIPHLSGARIKTKDLKQIKKTVWKWM